MTHVHAPRQRRLVTLPPWVLLGAGRATREAAGVGYALGAGAVGAGGAALWKGPTHDRGFVASAVGLALIGAWLAASAALTGASARAPRRRSA